MPINIISTAPDSDSGANTDRIGSAPGAHRDRTRTDAGLNNPPVMPLTPTEAPGRVTRKARQYEVAISELRAQGYTLAAICRTLAAAGVHVSLSTVRREAIRPATAATPASIASQQPHGAARCAASPNTLSAPSVAGATTRAALPHPAPPIPCSAKDEAEAFARTTVINPLVRAKESP